jgi:hypothetical protein
LIARVSVTGKIKQHGSTIMPVCWRMVKTLRSGAGGISPRSSRTSPPLLAQHAAWYGARCVGLDALVSVDEPWSLLAPPSQAPEVAALSWQGWRSVSVLCPPYGMVLYAASGAPAFLRLVTGSLFQ